MSRLFGTDGVRGVANTQITPELAFDLGRAATCYFGMRSKNPKILIGRDTRLSGPMLEAALAAGICSAGGEACLLGVVPTPTIAYLTANTDASAGVVISASHNPYMDNGIKFFSHQGYKLPDAVEDEIALLVERKECPTKRPVGSDVGVITQNNDLVMKYIEHVISSADTNLKGLKVVLDCANGAAYELAPMILQRLGAEVIVLFNEPNGTNINNGCGSTYLDSLRKAVLDNNADVGIAHDGDADRCLVVAEDGQVLDGDQMMLICALELMKKGLLPNNTVVSTVMSNIGFHMALKKHNAKCVVTPVGDRYVLEEMVRSGCTLGGEQSGHVIFSDYATTGDGLITAVQVLRAMVKNNTTLSELAMLMVKYPQVLINVKVATKDGWEENEQIRTAIAVAEKELQDNGRILVRASGTEKLIRVMAEGPDQGELELMAKKIADVIAKEQSL